MVSADEIRNLFNLAIEHNKQMQALEWARRVEDILLDVASVGVLCFLLKKGEVSFNNILRYLSKSDSPGTVGPKMDLLCDCSLVEKSWKARSPAEEYYRISPTGENVLKMILDIDSSSVLQCTGDYKEGKLSERLQAYIPTPIALLTKSA